MKGTETKTVKSEIIPPSTNLISTTLTPPTTPSHPPRVADIPPAAATTPSPTLVTAANASTSVAALLSDNSKNQLSINRFKGATPEMIATNGGPFKIRFKDVPNSEIFVITGLLVSHDMTIVKEGTEYRDQLQSKSTLTLSLINAETFAVCLGDQLNVIDTWINNQAGFQPTAGKAFRSPYDEFMSTVDLTWAQYERTRLPNIRGRAESRAGQMMKRKPQLNPVRYDDDDTEVKLSWDDLEINSILRAEVTMTAYKDKNKAYAGWTLNVSSVLFLRTPIGDVMNGDDASFPTKETEIEPTDSKWEKHSHLRF